jgi:hypothetical protein
VLARFPVMTWNMENLGVLKSSDPIGSGEHRVDDVDLACPRNCRSHRMLAEVSVAFPQMTTACTPSVRPRPLPCASRTYVERSSRRGSAATDTNPLTRASGAPEDGRRNI